MIEKWTSDAMLSASAVFRSVSRSCAIGSFRSGEFRRPRCPTHVWYYCSFMSIPHTLYDYVRQLPHHRLFRSVMYIQNVRARFCYDYFSIVDCLGRTSLVFFFVFQRVVTQFIESTMSFPSAFQITSLATAAFDNDNPIGFVDAAASLNHGGEWTCHGVD